MMVNHAIDANDDKAKAKPKPLSPVGQGISVYNPSLLSENSGAWSADFVQSVFTDVGMHQAMLVATAGNQDKYWPIFYNRSTVSATRGNPNSSERQLSVAAEAYYEKAASRLLELRQVGGEPVQVEEGAVDTALNLLGVLRSKQYSPPEISVQGEEAVVMLWSGPSTTFAVTVTDGEVGYVVRQNKKKYAKAHSLTVSQFLFLESH